MLRTVAIALFLVVLGGCSSKKKDEELKKSAEKAGQEIADALTRDLIKKEYEPLQARLQKGDVLKYDDYSQLRKDAYQLEKDKSAEGVALLKACRTLTESDAPAREQVAALEKTVDNIKKFGADDFWTGSMKTDCAHADELLGKIKEANLGETEGLKRLTAKKAEVCVPENLAPAKKGAAKKGTTKKKK